MTGTIPICTATRADGTPCKAYAMRGGTTCWHHGDGGRYNDTRLAKNVVIQRAAALSQTYGAPALDASPEELMLEEIQRTAGHVRWLEERIVTEAPDELAEAFWTYKRSTEVSGSSAAPDLLVSYAGVWLDLYNKERDRLINVVARALQLGIEERKVRLAERIYDQIGEAIHTMLTRLGHDPQEPHVRIIAYEALQQATGEVPQIEGATGVPGS